MMIDGLRLRLFSCSAVLLALGVLVAGCGGDDPAEIHSYVDSAGRSCTVDAHDISQTATCDVTAASVVSCTGGQEAAIVLNDDYDFETRVYTLESCGACVDRAAHTSYIASETCATVTCETDADCIEMLYMCMGGICRH